MPSDRFRTLLGFAKHTSKPQHSENLGAGNIENTFTLLNDQQKLKFVYPPLPRNTLHTQCMVRLLTILPGTMDEPMLCELSNRMASNQDELFSSIKYEALSYTWGEDNSGVNLSITLNGCSFPVATNLENALRALRMTSQERILWIDAICINQEDAVDKECQIHQMDMVYSRATAVLVWLGLASSDSKLAFDFCETIYSCFFPGQLVKESQVSQLPNYGYSSTKRTEMVDHLLTPEHAESWLALHRLTERPYWKRAWVFQEVVLAKKVICYCGQDQNRWASLAVVLEVLLDNFDPRIDLIYSLPSRVSEKGENSRWDSDALFSARGIALARTSHQENYVNSASNDTREFLRLLIRNRVASCQIPRK